MIYQYEGAVLRHINKVCDKIVYATYSKDFDIFGALGRVVELPSFYYSRELRDWSECPRTFSFLGEGGIGVNFVSILQGYVGRIYVSKESECQVLARDLRFYWDRNPYIRVEWLGSELEIGMRLLSLRIDSDRSVIDKRGALKFIEFKWSSVLAFDNLDKTLESGLVESIRLVMDGDIVKVVGRDDKVISVI